MDTQKAVVQDKINKLKFKISALTKSIQDASLVLSENTVDLLNKEYKAGGAKGRKRTMEIRRLCKEWKTKSMELAKLYDERKKLQK